MKANVNAPNMNINGGMKVNVNAPNVNAPNVNVNGGMVEMSPVNKNISVGIPQAQVNLPD